MSWMGTPFSAGGLAVYNFVVLFAPDFLGSYREDSVLPTGKMF